MRRLRTRAIVALSIAVLLVSSAPAPSGADSDLVIPLTPPQAIGANHTVPGNADTAIPLDAVKGDDRPIVAWQILSGPDHGTLDDCVDGVCTYRPDAGFTGTDRFTFSVFDGAIASSAATVTIIVVPPCGPGACIDNGQVLLAVNREGHLTVRNAAGSPAGDRAAGLHYLPTGAEAIATGCHCEGWGVADAASRLAGHAHQAFGVTNVELVDFSATGTTARSVVSVDGAMRVTHDFRPSPVTGNLYEVEVTIENTSTSGLGDVRYRRVIDWDIEPTPSNEHVTISTGNAAKLLFASNDGFAHPSPLAPRSDNGYVGSFDTAVAADHGALFDFGFGALAPGERVTFKLFYGAAANESAAAAAVAAAAAEVFSFGRPSVDGSTRGEPNTFVLAFNGVGSQQLFAPSAVDDELSAVAGVDATIDVLANDSDPNGDPLAVVDWSQPGSGTVACSGAGLCTYRSNADFVGGDSFSYTVADGTGGEATGIVHVTVSPPPVPVNAPPVVSAGPNVAVDVGVPVVLGGSVSDPDGDPVTVLWSLVPPVGCELGDAGAVVTTVTCSTPGVFTAMLTATDGVNPAAVDTARVRVVGIEPLGEGDPELPDGDPEIPNGDPELPVGDPELPGEGPGDPDGPPFEPPALCETIDLELDTNGFLGNRDGHRFSETAGVALPCAYYRVVLGSGDPAHGAGYQLRQIYERWRLEGLDADGNVVYSSPLTDDLPADEVWSSTDVGIADLDGVVSLRARHAGLGESVNSLHSVSVQLIPVEKP